MKLRLFCEVLALTSLFFLAPTQITATTIQAPYDFDNPYEFDHHQQLLSEVQSEQETVYVTAE